MTWISFVVVMLIFHAPMFNLARLMKIDGLELFFYGLAAWVVLSIALIALENYLKRDFLSKFRLRNGLIYAFRPYVSNNIAFALVCVVLLYTIIKFVLLSLNPSLKPFLPFDFGDIIVPSSFTLIAVFGFTFEQRYRYANDIRQNQLDRKRNQSNIVTPISQKRMR